MRDSGIRRPTTGGITQRAIYKTPVYMLDPKQMI